MLLDFYLYRKGKDDYKIHAITSGLWPDKIIDGRYRLAGPFESMDKAKQFQEGLE